MTTRCGKEGQEVSERLFEGQSWVKRQTLHTPVSLAPCLASRKYNRFIVEGQKGRTCRPITIRMLQPWTLTSERLVLIMEVEVRHIWHALSVQLTAWCFSFQSKRGRKEGRKEGREDRMMEERPKKEKRAAATKEQNGIGGTCVNLMKSRGLPFSPYLCKWAFHNCNRISFCRNPSNPQIKNTKSKLLFITQKKKTPLPQLGKPNMEH